MANNFAEAFQQGYANRDQMMRQQQQDQYVAQDRAVKQQQQARIDATRPLVAKAVMEGDQNALRQLYEVDPEIGQFAEAAIREKKGASDKDQLDEFKQIQRAVDVVGQSSKDPEARRAFLKTKIIPRAPIVQKILQGQNIDELDMSDAGLSQLYDALSTKTGSGSYSELIQTRDLSRREKESDISKTEREANKPYSTATASRMERVNDILSNPDDYPADVVKAARISAGIDARAIERTSPMEREDAKYLSSLRGKSDHADMSLSKIDKLRNLIASAKSGYWQNVMGIIGKPLNADAAKNKQVFDAEVNRLWTDAIQSMKGLGSMTEMEGSRIAMTLPDYSNMPETNLAVLSQLEGAAREAKSLFNRRKIEFDSQYSQPQPVSPRGSQTKTQSGTPVKRW